MNIALHFSNVRGIGNKALALLAFFIQVDVVLGDQCDCSEIIASCIPSVEIANQEVLKEYDGRSVEYSFDLTVTVIPEGTQCALLEFGIENKHRTAVSGFFDASRNYGQTHIYRKIFSGSSIRIKDTVVAGLEDVYLIENKMFQSCKVCNIEVTEALSSEEEEKSLDWTVIQDQIQKARMDADKDARDRFLSDSNVITSRMNSNQGDARSQLDQFRSATDTQLLGLTGNIRGQLEAGVPLEESRGGRDCDAVAAQHKPILSSLQRSAESGSQPCALAPEIERAFTAAKRDFANCTTNNVEGKRVTISNLDAMIKWARDTKLACSQ